MEEESQSLADRGSNGGLAGTNMRVLYTSDRTVTVSGVDDHRIHNIPIGTCAGVIDTHRGKAIAICHEYVGWSYTV